MSNETTQQQTGRKTMTNSDRAREEWLDANDPDRVGDWAHTSITVEDGWHHDQCRECGLLVHRPDCSILAS